MPGIAHLLGAKDLLHWLQDSPLTTALHTSPLLSTSICLEYSETLLLVSYTLGVLEDSTFVLRR